MASFSIVIPAYNEENGIGPVLDAIHAQNFDAEVIVVDDGSTDRTAEVAAEHGARVVRRAGNIGYGRSLKDGINAASTDVIVITDADGTYPIEAIPELMQEFEKGFDMVVGARQGAVYWGSCIKAPARLVFKFLVEFSAGCRIPDINSGLRVFRKSTAQQYEADLCDTFSFTTTITLTYLLTRKMVTYIPIAYEKRIGKSKVRFIRDSLRTLQYIVQCIARFNPLKLFLLLGVAPLVIGLLATPLDPLALVAGIFVSVIVFALGLFAESIRKQR